MGLLVGLSVCSCQVGAPTATAGADEKRSVDAARTPGDERALSATLDELVRTSQRHLGVAGVSVAVVWHDRPLLVQGYGFADVRGRVPMRADHVFRIGSITKSFTAAAVLKLEAQGKLGVFDPLSKYLPEYTASRAVTLYHLLTHTSGIPDYVDIPYFGERQEKARTQAELVALFSGLPLGFAPGSEWSYCNSGYFLGARDRTGLGAELCGLRGERGDSRSRSP